MKSLYSVLGVATDSSSKDIERAYKKLALKYHPDRSTGSEHEFREIVGAYEILCDVNTRTQYDQQLKHGPRRPSPRDELKQVKEHYRAVIEQMETRFEELQEVHRAAMDRAAAEIARLATELGDERKASRLALLSQTDKLVQGVAKAQIELEETRRAHVRDLDDALQAQFEMLTKLNLKK